MIAYGTTFTNVYSLYIHKFQKKYRQRSKLIFFFLFTTEVWRIVGKPSNILRISFLISTSMLLDNVLTVNRLHHTEIHLMSFNFLPSGNFKTIPDP